MIESGSNADHVRFAAEVKNQKFRCPLAEKFQLQENDFTKQTNIENACVFAGEMFSTMDRRW